MPLQITLESSLNDMIEAGLPKFAAQLEEISGSATKEYALESNLRKMKEEWKDVCFDCVMYRYVIYTFFVAFYITKQILNQKLFWNWETNPISPARLQVHFYICILIFNVVY